MLTLFKAIESVKMDLKRVKEKIGGEIIVKCEINIYNYISKEIASLF